MKRRYLLPIILALAAMASPSLAADAISLKYESLFGLTLETPAGAPAWGMLLPSTVAGQGRLMVICPTAVPPVAWYTVTKGDNPQPVPPNPTPIPPNPTPVPVPPQPVPVPPTPVVTFPLGKYVAWLGPEPKAMEGFTVDQVAMLLSADRVTATAKWVDKGPDGKTPQQRIIPRSIASTLTSEPWATVISKTDASKPQLVMVNGATQKVVDLPANLAAYLDLGKQVFGSAADLGAVAARGPPPILTAEQIAQYEADARAAKQHVDKVGVVRMLGALPRDRVRHPVGSIPGSVTLAAAGVKVIPRTEWPARVAALTAANAGLKPLTYVLTPYDQASTNYCWVNSVCQGATALNYVYGCPIVYWSAASVGGPVTGYRNMGGYPGDAIQYATSDGAVDWTLWPNTSISSSYSKLATVTADRPRHKICATIADLGSTKIQDETATCVLLGAPVAVCYNWWSHAVLVCGLVQQDGTWYFIIRNSWGEYEDHGFFLLPIDGKGCPDDAQALLGVNLSQTERPRRIDQSTTLAA